MDFGHFADLQLHSGDSHSTLPAVPGIFSWGGCRGLVLMGDDDDGDDDDDG